jgi:hypothetical protein
MNFADSFVNDLWKSGFEKSFGAGGAKDEEKAVTGIAADRARHR